MLTVGSLFSGIGGFDLGLERAGMRVLWQSEIDPYASAVLRKHWPEVPNHGGVSNIGIGVGRVDVICGGFPCQPFSTAARGRNTAADLWPEMVRVVAGLRPTWVLAENVPGIGLAGIERVCNDLEYVGYAVWPMVVDTAPPNRTRGRRRVIFVAHANSEGEPRFPVHAEMAGVSEISRGRWADDPAPVGVDDGLPGRMDRLRCLGNAITPYAAEIIGRAIVSAA
jgi:DNA (cytosine-5)-methyltransferase 1